MNQTVVALGMFDGVHLGHRVLLERAAELAHRNGDGAVVFTYANHPRELFGGDVPYLGTNEQREALILACGCDRVDCVPFDAAFASMAPDAFVDWLNARYEGTVAAIVVGYDYRFGAKAAGDVTLLKTLCEQRGIELTVIPEVSVDDVPCASTYIRDAIRSGDVERAARMLGRPYELSGTVVHAKALGRLYHFPTANMGSGTQVLPKDGVYATVLVFAGNAYPAVTNVGTNPTAGGRARSVETHAIGEQLDLYGKTIAVRFLKRLRDEKTFENKDLLFAQIARDAEMAKKVFQEHEKSVYNSERLC